MNIDFQGASRANLDACPHPVPPPQAGRGRRGTYSRLDGSPITQPRGNRAEPQFAG
jgi:hypothetical protein